MLISKTNLSKDEIFMGKSLTRKILEDHLVVGEYVPGKEIGIKIDQTLTQDATGTMAYLQFEAMDLKQVKTELSVSYVDHNTIHVGFENADDHKYLQTAQYHPHLNTHQIAPQSDAMVVFLDFLNGA